MTRQFTNMHFADGTRAALNYDNDTLAIQDSEGDRVAIILDDVGALQLAEALTKWTAQKLEQQNEGG